MSSSKQEGTAAAASVQSAQRQLGTMSLGESAERKDDDAKPTAKNGTPAKLCSACGKKSATLKKCNACKCVWYCDKKCQNKHRKDHKKECRLIKEILDNRGGKLDLGTELDVGPLGKLPPRDECPICMCVLPLHHFYHRHMLCCGKTICGGCDYQHRLRTGEERTCAFCRSALPGSDEEMLAKLRKKAKLKDPRALHNMAMSYGTGQLGLAVDQAKCVDLIRESADLGCPLSHYQLGNFHKDGDMGLEQNKEKALIHWKIAAEMGVVVARYNLGFAEAEDFNPVAAMRHWRLSTSVGHNESKDKLIISFEEGLLHHSDLAETLQGMYLARAERRSKDRDHFIEHMKRTGEY